MILNVSTSYESTYAHRAMCHGPNFVPSNLINSNGFVKQQNFTNTNLYKILQDNGDFSILVYTHYNDGMEHTKVQNLL